VISDFAEMGGRVLEISGGEPLEYSRLCSLVSCASDLGLEVRLYTSGYFLSEKRIRKLLRCGVDRFVLSIHGHNERTHDGITGIEGSFRRCLENLTVLKGHGAWVGVHFVPMKPNYRYLKETIELVSKIGVDEFALLRFVPQGRGLTNRNMLELRPSETWITLWMAYQLVSEYYDLKVRIGSHFNIRAALGLGDSVVTCGAGRRKALVTASGDVVPCPALRQCKNYIAGNVLCKPLTEIITRLGATVSASVPGACKLCLFSNICAGGCLAQRLIAYGDAAKGPDPACPQQTSERSEPPRLPVH
jgi:radical SAM protein with 4Fe4S-binding SPASM domain